MQIRNTWKSTLAVGLVAFAIGYGSAFFHKPSEEKLQNSKTVQTSKNSHVSTATHTNQIVTKTITKKADGTVITQIQTQNIADVSTSRNKSSNRDKSTEKKKTIINSTPNWMVSAMYGFNYTNKFSSTYGVDVQKRLLGNIFVGGYAMTDKSLGISVGLQF